jgi:ribosomal protein S17E
MVEGHLRTDLIYKLLAQDIIERYGSFPTESFQKNSSDESVDILCRKVQKITDMETHIVNSTLKSLINSGYIKSQPASDKITWHWTHNNKA